MEREETHGAGTAGSRSSFIICTEDDFPAPSRPLHCGQPMVGNGTNRWLCSVCAFQPVKVHRPVPIIPGPPCPHCNTAMRSKGIQWLCHKCNKWFAKHRV